jgi:FAD/FMN-containing dehydrogenase
VVNKALRDAVAGSGLFYPPDPSSYDWCTVGGNLSTNSGGLCCVKYGVTTDYVLGLEVVLADGRVLRTGRRRVKGVAGYDLAQLCREAGAEFVHTTDDATEGDLLLQARRMALPALEQLGSTLIDDVAVPRSRIAAFLDGCDGIAAQRGLTIGVVGHAGDGNMHPTICFDPDDADQRERAFAAFDDILEAASPSAARSPASTASGRSRWTGWSARSGPSRSTCTARSRTRSTRPACSTPGSCSAAQPSPTSPTRRRCPRPTTRC